MNRVVVLIGISLVLALSGGLGMVRGTEPSTRATPTPAPVIAVGQGGDLGQQIEALQADLRRVPGDHDRWASLALAYVEQARGNGDPALYELADEAVARSFEEREADNFSALAARAAVRAARHEFPTALADAQEALDLNPLNPTALAIRIDALTELGRYREQLAALREADRKQPGVGIVARYAYAYELRGDLDRATAVLRRASTSGSRSDQAYLLTALADLERHRGNLKTVQQLLRRADLAVPGQLSLQVEWARLDVARDRPQRALTRLRNVVAEQPSFGDQVELAELLLHLGRDREAREHLAAAASALKALEAQGFTDNLEVALFEADHGSPARALEAAQEEWRRRQSIHVADALAWALHQSGRSREALQYAEAATRLGTPEATFWIHRGTIEAALGLDRRARTHLERGLTRDPGLSPWQADQARAALSELDRGRG
ncbi:MAG TPA: tetratricopeptide repeat protein [Nocardioidaceae bacterium]|nr:tetratricopeptide repeat protein [Nocardioidaceae bacterium]